MMIDKQSKIVGIVMVLLFLVALAVVIQYMPADPGGIE